MSQGARAVGIANIAMNGTVLDTWFPSPELLPIDGTSGTHRVSAHELSPKFLKLIGADHDRLVELVPVCTVIADLDAPPIDAHDVFLRLHLLSHRMVEPLTINMAGALELLQPVVWTNKGPCLADNFETVRTNLRARGLIHVYGIDRLPRMVDYVVPSGVTIAEAERVRLGAYLAEGTSVMREGYVSYNAGSLGPARIEGRLSSSVVVGGGNRSVAVVGADGIQGQRVRTRLDAGRAGLPAAPVSRRDRGGFGRPVRNRRQRHARTGHHGLRRGNRYPGARADHRRARRSSHRTRTVFHLAGGEAEHFRRRLAKTCGIYCP